MNVIYYIKRSRRSVYVIVITCLICLLAFVNAKRELVSPQLEQGSTNKSASLTAAEDADSDSVIIELGKDRLRIPKSIIYVRPSSPLRFERIGLFAISYPEMRPVCVGPECSIEETYRKIQRFTMNGLNIKNSN